MEKKRMKGKEEGSEEMKILIIKRGLHIMFCKIAKYE